MYIHKNTKEEEVVDLKKVIFLAYINRSYLLVPWI